MSALRRYRGLILVGVALMALSIAVYFTKSGTRPLTGVEGWLKDALAPVESGLMRSVGAWERFVERLALLSHLESERVELLDKIALLESINASLEEEHRENVRLKALLALKEATPAKTVAARVIARDPATWANTIVIDRGTSDGVSPDMPVIAASGLVGRVIQSSKNTSTVLLVTDNRSAVSALIRRSRDIVIVEGSPEGNGFMVAKPLNARLVGDKEEWTSQVRMRVGDAVISSGLGGVFPKGLTLGRVVTIGEGRYGVAKTATVKPAVDMHRIELVLVITNAAFYGGPE